MGARCSSWWLTIRKLLVVVGIIVVCILIFALLAVVVMVYLDKMSELLLEKKLRDSAEEDEIRKIARVRTLRYSVD